MHCEDKFLPIAHVDTAHRMCEPSAISSKTYIRCDEPLFSDRISATVKMPPSSHHTDNGFINTGSLTFNSVSLESALISAVGDKQHLNDRVTAALPLCKHLALECHDLVDKFPSIHSLLSKTVIRLLGVHAGKLLHLVNEDPMDRVLGLISITARVEWLISCLVERRLQLKDNLESADLKILLGEDLVLILQCLMGCVKGFNLKNLTWHGFVSPSNVPAELCSLLFCTVLSLLSRVSSKNIKFREETKLPALRINLLPHPLNCLELSQIITQSSIIHPEHLPLWRKLLQKHRDWCQDDTFSAVSLNIVLLQQCLRCVWVTLSSGGDRRRCSAQDDEFYVTLDEMFSPSRALVTPRTGASYYTSVITSVNSTDNNTDNNNTVNNTDNNTDNISVNSTDTSDINTGDNVLIPCLGEGKFKAFLDLFIHGSGLRLRDKLSHAECSNIDQGVLDHLFHLTFSVLCLFSPADVRASSVAEYCDKYMHQFHPDEIIQDTIRDIEGSCLDLDSLLHKTSSLDEIAVSDLDFTAKLIELSSNAPAMLTSSATIPLFVGPAKMKYYNLLIDILNNIRTLSRELCNVSKEKLSLYESRKLRSRQRKNFSVLISSLPVFISVLRLTPAFASAISVKVESLTCYEFETNAAFVKVMKRNLKSFENASNLVAESKWREIGEYLTAHLTTWLGAIEKGVL